MKELNREFCEGYSDGGNVDTPEPGLNRSDAYKHSFAVRRAEINGAPIPASTSRARVKAIEAQFNNLDIGRE